MNIAKPSAQNYNVSELQRDLINSLTWLLKESNDYNMVINVGEPPNIKSFKVHTSVLKARSLYFRAILSNGRHFPSNGKNSLVELTQANIKPDLFEVILKYLYTGEISLESEKDAKKILEYAIAAETLWLFPLVQYIENYLVYQMNDWLKSNFVYLLTTIRSNKSYKSSFKLLHEFSNDVLKKHPHLLFNSNDFHTLPESILINLLQRRDFSKDVAEKKILSIVLDWGIKQNDGLVGKNVSDWNSSDFSKLKTSLQNYIPLIRYTSIPPEIFFDIVGPYKKIFTPCHYERIMQIPTFVAYNKLMRPPIPPRKSPALLFPKQPIFPSTPLLASLLREFPKPPLSTPTPPMSRSNSPMNMSRSNSPMNTSRSNSPMNMSRSNSPVNMSRSNSPVNTSRSNSPVNMSRSNSPLNCPTQNRFTSGLNPIVAPSPPVTQKRQSAVIKSRCMVRRRTKSLLFTSDRPNVILVKRANTLPTSSRRESRPISIYSIETSNNSSSPIKAKLKRKSISPQKRTKSTLEPITPLKSIEPQVVGTSPLVIRKEDSSKKGLNISQATPLKAVKSFEPQVAPLVIRKENLSKKAFPPDTPLKTIKSFGPQIVLNRASPVMPLKTVKPLEPQLMDASLLNIRKDLNKKANRKISIISLSRPSTSNLFTSTPIMI